MGLSVARTGRSSFNCAAPFRERLDEWVPRQPQPKVCLLQLCRPLSGAVSQRPPTTSVPNTKLQLCRPLSGAVSPAGVRTAGGQKRFNCAAPFRERLAGIGAGIGLGQAGLQLCRPLSGAVSRAAAAIAGITPGLQLCRPLSGAVRMMQPSNPALASRRFNCAAPFRERLGGPTCAAWCSRGAGFNCAAPFRERLGLLKPQGGGGRAGLQLCRPLSGAVSMSAPR